MLYCDTLTLQSEWRTHKEVLRWYPSKLRNTEAPFNRNPLFLLRLRSERALKHNKQDFSSPLSLPLSFSWKYHFLWGGVITEEHALRSLLHQKSSPPLELANEKLTVGYKMKRDFCSILAEENHFCHFWPTQNCYLHNIICMCVCLCERENF